MEKQAVLALFLVFILILSNGVYAAGSGGSSSNSPNENPNTASGTTRTSEVDCEDPSTYSSRKERITCRINPENKDRIRVSERSTIHESCRSLALTATTRAIPKENCRKLYSDLYDNQCYEKQGREKLACFKRVSGLGTAAVSGNADKTALRKLVVSYLYQLEEWLEEAVEDDKLEKEKAADIIDFIIEIKEDIMNGENRDVVKPKIETLRRQLNEIRNSIP